MVRRNPGYVVSKPGYKQLINFQGCNPGYRAQDLNIFHLKFDKIMHISGKNRQYWEKSAENRRKFIVNLQNSPKN